MFDEVFHKLNRSVMFDFTLFGHTISVGDTVVVTWIIMAVLIIASLIVTRKLSVDKPGKVQCVVEMLVNFVKNMCEEAMGHHWRTFLPFIGTLLLYIGVSNIITIFNIFPFFHLYPPTKDINVTGALAVIVICVVVVSSFRYKGVKGWAKSLVHPIPVMLPFNLLEYITKPFSLCLRLFGNVIAAFLIMELLLSFAPYLGAPFSIYFDLFDGILQAYIFVYLTTLYIGEAVEEHEA